MADNIEVAGKTIATDEVSIGGALVHTQRAKLGFGADGSYTGDVSRTNPYPVDVLLNTGAIQSGALQPTPQFDVINLTATGTLKEAVSGKKIRVLSLLMTVDVQDGDELYIFKTAGAGTAITGTIGDTNSTGNLLVVEYSFSPLGHFETLTSQLLELSLAGTTPSAQGSFVWIEV